MADQLKQVIAGTLSLDAGTRKAAEAALKKAQTAPGHPLLVLEIVANSDASAAAVRQAAAVHFKNIIKKGWDVHREDGNDGIVFTEQERTTIKSHLVQLMCTVPPQIQVQLSESISLIAKVDYHENWKNLLGELVQQFHSTDPAVVTGVLKTANSIFKSFRYVDRSDELYNIILYTLHGIQEPITILFNTIGQTVKAIPNDKAQLTILFEQLRLICRIFYSLNYQDLPEYFEDHMKEWMEEFAFYLQYKNPLLVDDAEELEPSPIDKLQTAIIKVLELYADKDEEPFMEFLPKFTELVWHLLMNVSAYPKHDALATTSIKFLGSLVEKVMHRSLFENKETLRQIIVNIVIPNLTFRDSDEERFEDDPREYIITEVEGSDSESRRKCSQDLLRSMCRQFEVETTEICASHVGSMLAEYAADPNGKWAAKDAAIHLMMGVSIRKESSMGGVSEVNPGVNVMDFFQQQIFPELQDTNHTSRPVLKATSLKYVSVFRNQFSRENLVQLMPVIIAHLASPVVVVHTFTAYAVERILLTKEEVTGGAKVPKFGKAELKPFIEPLFKGLFPIIDAIIGNDQQNENDYAMKCVMRALATANEDIIPVTQEIITRLTMSLGHIAKNPRNPQFNHYLFESIAVLVRSVCSKDPAATETFEQLLFGPFTTILNADIAEFTPYVFQVLAQLLEYRPAGDGLGPSYEGLFGALLAPVLWDKKGNVPALARLLQAYIQKAAPELVPQLLPILGVFQKLLASKATEASAFDILTSSIVYFPHEAIEPQISQILQLLLMRLQNSRTPRYTRLVTTFFALFVGKYGPQVFFDRLNAMQGGLSMQILAQVWAPRLRNDPPSQKAEAKVQVVGVTKLLCESPAMIADANSQKVWAETLVGLVALLTSATFKPKPSATHDEPEIETGYDAQFSKLVYAHKEVQDPFPEVADATAFFVQSLHRLLSSHGSQLLPLIQQGLSADPKLATGLDSMFKQAGLQLG